MRIGMIGLQSRHLDFFATQINIEKRFSGVSVVGVWGDDEVERLPAIAEQLQIPAICRSPKELLELCDTVFVLPRDGSTHMRYAKIAQDAGKNLFVDKPFAMHVSDADEMILTARQKKLSLAGGSTLCYLPEVQQLRQRALASPGCTISISYSADPESIYSGWAYYGSHLCDLCTRVCGVHVKSVLAKRAGKEVTVSVEYDDREVFLRSTPQPQRPAIQIGEDPDKRVELDDTVCFRYGLAGFISELQNGMEDSFLRLRTSALLLDSCLLSLQTGKRIYL